MKKILHITNDNKFISQAIKSFENVYPHQNTVWMFRTGHDGNVSNNNRDYEFSFIDTFNPKFLEKFKCFDLIVIHAFDFYKYPLVAFAPRGIKFAWLGWGYEYYDAIYTNSNDFYLPGTIHIKNKCNKAKFFKKIKPIYTVKQLASKLIIFLLKKRALNRIDSISTVLKEDYDLLKHSKVLKPLPNYVAWNYGSLEESLVKDYIGKRITGNAVLVGNSATFTNNHVEAFEILEKACISENLNLDIITPLSYGDSFYKEVIIEKGLKYFRHNFRPLVNFMPINEYVSLIRQCGFVVMNHKRQQAVGNIIIMLYLGARVFLRRENPTYQMFKRLGIVLNTIDELILTPSLLKTPLEEKEILNNIDILYDNWSKDAIDNKTKNLVEYHIGN